jgi:hypothetical protein
MHKIGIIGNGFVGRATITLQCDDINIMCYDVNPNLCVPKGTTMHDLLTCCAIFVSVPTPINRAGKTSMKYVDSVISQLRELKYDGFIIIRSTVPVGTSDHYKCNFMPEFLTEKNATNDFVNNANWIFGCNDDENKDAFMKLMTSIIRCAHAHEKIAHERITFMSNKEAEMVTEWSLLRQKTREFAKATQQFRVMMDGLVLVELVFPRTSIACVHKWKKLECNIV